MARHSTPPTRFPNSIAFWLVACIMLICCGVSVAQENPSTLPDQPATSQLSATPEAGSAASDRPAPPDAATVDVAADPAARAAAEDAFQTKFAQWKELLKRLRLLRNEFQTADSKEMISIHNQWDASIQQAEAMLPELIDAVLTAYQLAPGDDPDKTNFLVKALEDFVKRDLYEPALKIGSVLAKYDCDEATVYRDTGYAAFALNRYDQMDQILNKASDLDLAPEGMSQLREQMEEYKKLWAEEQKILAREAEADDLPRVKLTTTKGDIVVELFENEAPETVGNFISLVKKGFYDDLTFHRVLAGFMAQGGCPLGDGSSGPGYSIYDECKKPNARMHFRGSLSMAKRSVPDSGGSQFFITFRPIPHLNAMHTVFGRVVEGMDVVAKLQRRDPEQTEQPEPDRIVKAEVLRDRGHDYQPNKVE